MKTTIFVILFAMTIQSCDSKNNGKNENKDTVNKAAVNQDTVHKVEPATPVSGGFDLASLTFKETIQSVDQLSGVKVSASPSEEKTLFGYDRSESTSPKLLIYNQIPLAGEADNMTSKVIFHYKEKGGELAMYELRIYSAVPNNALVKAIEQKVGQPVVNNSPKDSDSGVNFKQYVWVKGDIIYVLLQELNQTGVKVSNLAVFKNDNKDFYNLLGQKGYAIDAVGLIKGALAKGSK
ncbi:hypothetical protein [Pedobacter cryoconitis]|uniref:Lipoprotein n=1 Tax=Pedobacter cryoconitis TaxID=188932 RepID=A0A7X0IZT6_9SPHI|nr:hypothetical protein [Pedobacter cryoconitis]MBB6498449.1 hypothetical protein [Pedobacter cryoconitis]